MNHTSSPISFLVVVYAKVAVNQNIIQLYFEMIGAVKSLIIQDAVLHIFLFELLTVEDTNQTTTHNPI